MLTKTKLSDIKTGRYVIECEKIDQKLTKCVISCDGFLRAKESESLYINLSMEMTNNIPIGKECIVSLEQLESYLRELNGINANSKTKSANKELRDKVIQIIKNATLNTKLTFSMYLSEYHIQVGSVLKQTREIQLSMNESIEPVQQKQNDSENYYEEKIITTAPVEAFEDFRNDNKISSDNSEQKSSDEVWVSQPKAEEKNSIRELIELYEPKIADFQKRRYEIRQNIKDLDVRINQLTKKIAILRQKVLTLNL
jgi:hypothetical protein